MSRVYKRAGSPLWQAEWYDLEGRRHQQSTQCTDRRAAEARLREWERDSSDPARAAARTTTLRSAVEALVEQRHQEAVAGRKSHATAKFYAAKAGHAVRIFGDDFRLSELTAVEVDKYIGRRRAEGAGDGTIHKELVTLRGAMRLALRRKLWSGDIDAVFPVAFSPAYVPKERWLSPLELEKLLAELPNDRGAIVAYMVATGAETQALVRARAGDLAGELASVRLRGTKRATRDREVPVVMPWQRQLLEVAKAHGRGDGKGGLHRRWQNIRRDLHIACEKAGIEPVSPNDLRRTFGHWMRGEGLAPSTVGAALGHKDGRMAERVYAKLDVTELAATMRRESGIRPEPRSAECHNSVPQSPDLGALCAPGALSKVPKTSRDSVPRDGVEPPTRGFSVPVVTVVIPRKYRALVASPAPVVTIVSGARR